MREIKFRLRLGDKIVGYERIKPDEDGYLISTYSFDNSIGGWIFEPIKHKDKDQFIGLKDKNGKEIYEGDIIIDCLGEGNERIGLVLWGYSGGFDWFIPENIYSVNFENIDLNEWEYAEYTCRDFSDLVGRNRFEIIGNIYENLELWEKEG